MAKLIKQKDGRLVLLKQDDVIANCKTAPVVPIQQKVQHGNSMGFMNQFCDFTCPLMTIENVNYAGKQQDMIVIKCGGNPVLFPFEGIFDLNNKPVVEGEKKSTLKLD